MVDVEKEDVKVLTDSVTTSCSASGARHNLFRKVHIKSHILNLAAELEGAFFIEACDTRFIDIYAL